jgi:hypothetical protein
VCRWWTTASRIIYGFGWDDRREGSSEDFLPSPRAPQDKKIRWTNSSTTPIQPHARLWPNEE